MKFLFSHNKFLKGKILLRSPLLSTLTPHLPKQKNPPEKACKLQSNHYCMYTLVKVCNLQPLPWELLGSKLAPKT